MNFANRWLRWTDARLIKVHLHLKLFGGALKWPLKGGSHLIEVAATAGLTVLSPSFPIVWVGCGVGAVVTNDLCITKLYAWLMMDSAGLLWYFLIILTIIKISLI